MEYKYVAVCVAIFGFINVKNVSLVDIFSELLLTSIALCGQLNKYVNLFITVICVHSSLFSYFKLLHLADNGLIGNNYGW